MKSKYQDFVCILIASAKKEGKARTDRLEFGQMKMLDAIRAYFEYKQEKTVKETLEYYFKEGYLAPSSGGFVLTEKAIKEFW